MVLLTAISGALVAGRDAGLIYNEFPLMGGMCALVVLLPMCITGQLIPEGIMDKKPWYMNIFDNDTTIQFNHRVLVSI